MDAKRDHLGDCCEACYRAVVCVVFPVSSFEDDDRPAFQQPVVCIVPPISDFPFDHALPYLIDRFLDGKALFDGE